MVCGDSSCCRHSAPLCWFLLVLYFSTTSRRLGGANPRHLVFNFCVLRAGGQIQGHTRNAVTEGRSELLSNLRRTANESFVHAVRTPYGKTIASRFIAVFGRLSHAKSRHVSRHIILHTMFVVARMEFFCCCKKSLFFTYLGIIKLKNKRYNHG